MNQDVEHHWSMIKSIAIDAAQNQIGIQEKYERNSRFDDECQNAIRLKNEARQKCLAYNTRHNRTIREEKRKVATKLCRNKKKEMMEEHIKILEQYNVNKNSRKFYETEL
jgi:phage terminase large subunit